MLPMGFGCVEGVTHDYKRHATTSLFAALNVLNGAVLATCTASGVLVVPVRDRHRRACRLGRALHRRQLHLLASRPRWDMHFIPTYSSWLNQVERSSH